MANRKTIPTVGYREGADQDSVVDSEINSPTPGLPSIVDVEKGAQARLLAGNAPQGPKDPPERLSAGGTFRVL